MWCKRFKNGSQERLLKACQRHHPSQSTQILQPTHQFHAILWSQEGEKNRRTKTSGGQREPTETASEVQKDSVHEKAMTVPTQMVNACISQDSRMLKDMNTFNFGRGFILDTGYWVPAGDLGIHTTSTRALLETFASLCTGGYTTSQPQSRRMCHPWLFLLLFPHLSKAILFFMPNGTIPNQSIRAEWKRKSWPPPRL